VVGPPPQQVEDTFRTLPTVEGYDVETWVEGLEVPWSLVFLSEAEALVSERPGRIRLLKGGKLSEAPYAELEVVHRGEGGLMGLAVHPEFPREPYVYAMHTYEDGGNLYNRVVRLRHGGDRGSLERAIIEKIPGHRVHNGGRIAFGPDGMLYICTGDIWQAELAQDRNSLAGKILRLTPEGEIPPDNPFEGSPVYSLGHRNPQGLAWHPEAACSFLRNTALPVNSACGERTSST
jgi:glucose/arabinose dehydrogenase